MVQCNLNQKQCSSGVEKKKGDLTVQLAPFAHLYKSPSVPEAIMIETSDSFATAFNGKRSVVWPFLSLYICWGMKKSIQGTTLISGKGDLVWPLRQDSPSGHIQHPRDSHCSTRCVTSLKYSWSEGQEKRVPYVLKAYLPAFLSLYTSNEMRRVK